MVCNVLRGRQQEARQQTQMKKETGGTEERISWANRSSLPLQQSGCVKAVAARIGGKGLSHGHRQEGPVMANAPGANPAWPSRNITQATQVILNVLVAAFKKSKATGKLILLMYFI